MENQTMWELQVFVNPGDSTGAGQLVSSAYLGGFISSIGKNPSDVRVVATPVRDNDTRPMLWHVPAQSLNKAIAQERMIGRFPRRRIGEPYPEFVAQYLNEPFDPCPNCHDSSCSGCMMGAGPDGSSSYLAAEFRMGRWRERRGL